MLSQWTPAISKHRWHLFAYDEAQVESTCQLRQLPRQRMRINTGERDPVSTVHSHEVPDRTGCVLRPGFGQRWVEALIHFKTARDALREFMDRVAGHLTIYRRTLPRKLCACVRARVCVFAKCDRAKSTIERVAPVRNSTWNFDRSANGLTTWSQKELYELLSRQILSCFQSR